VLEILDDTSASTTRSCTVEISRSRNGHDRQYNHQYTFLICPNKPLERPHRSL
jgi:hypothetical protein